jgi:CubicO group peptidase (beta-lactamase class C family)
MKPLAMKQFVCSLAIILGMSINLHSQDIKSNQSVKEALVLVKSWLNAQQAYEEIPGMSAAIVYDQELVWSGGFGEANPESGIVTSAETIHSICSISKLFTSISIMQLKENGKLRLDDPISRHLTWFKDLEQQFDGAPEITIEGILTHSAGLPRESDHGYWTGDFKFPAKEAIIAGLKNQETLYEPWQYFQYSNLGLTLAGQIVEQVSGMKYEEYVQQNILEPLGLSNTRPYMPQDMHGKELAIGYTAMTREGSREEVAFFDANGINPAAGFSSTADDLATFASWQLKTYHGEENQVLHRNTLKEMYRVHYMDPNWTTSWGIGFSVRKMNEKTVVGHGGSCPGYRSQLLIDPESKVAVTFMANASGVNTGKFTREIYEIMAPALKKAAKKEDKEEADEMELKDFSKYTGTYSGSPWWGENYIFQTGDKLGRISFPSDDPSDFGKLKHIEGNKFKRIRNDEKLGETIEFVEDEGGSVIGYKVFNNYYPKIE